ncbi:MAG: hypothetical protein KY439_06985 [Actinobacteria bacterium]|nr:hypothetical protein [Actinomycetota bacterium]
MPNDQKALAGGLAAIISGAVVCCSLPLLLGAGVTLGAAGLALGSGVAVAAGAVLAVWGWRRHRAARSCEVGSSAGRQPESADHTTSR